MKNEKSLIRFNAVEKRYGSQKVLSIESLEFNEGEVVLIIGPNGSGKSTLLRLCGRIISPDKGYIFLDSDLINKNLGYVPQSGGLYDDLSLIDNFRIRRSLFNCRNNEETDPLLTSWLDLDPFLKKRFVDLSGGYKRIGAVLAALDIEPKWLLLDEPFSGVDEKKREILINKIIEMQIDLSLTVISMPNFIPDELPFTDKVIFLEEGVIQCVKSL